MWKVVLISASIVFKLQQYDISGLQTLDYKLQLYSGRHKNEHTSSRNYTSNIDPWHFPEGSTTWKDSLSQKAAITKARCGAKLWDSVPQLQ